MKSIFCCAAAGAATIVAAAAMRNLRMEPPLGRKGRWYHRVIKRLTIFARLSGLT
jgi:hypothetical protein